MEQVLGGIFTANSEKGTINLIYYDVFYNDVLLRGRAPVRGASLPQTNISINAVACMHAHAQTACMCHINSEPTRSAPTPQASQLRGPRYDPPYDFSPRS